MISIEEIMDKYSIVIAWGCGRTFQLACTECLRIDCLVDSNKKNWGKSIKGIVVRNPETILSENKEKKLIIIFTEIYWREIVIQIEKMEIEADIILSSMIFPSISCNDSLKKSFALFGEDAIIKGISDRYSIPIKHYIDIGANHPYYGNATILFYLNGAKGCLVEPNENCCLKLRKCRYRDTVVNAGIADKNSDGKENKYYLIEGMDTRNTFSKEMAEYYRRHGFSIKTEYVKTMTLNALINNYNEKINYINIDVEGLEYDILKDFNFEKYGVEIFNIEKGDSRVTQLMLSNKYELVSETPSNWIFVKEGLVRKQM